MTGVNYFILSSCDSQNSSAFYFRLRKTSKRASLSVKQKVKRADHEKAEILLMCQAILVAGKTKETNSENLHVRISND